MAVTSISPTSGSTNGGDSVVITGVGFTTATAVKFGTTAATSFVVNSDTQITAVSPAGTSTVDVTVTTPVGTTATSAADQFTYLPSVTGLSPSSGTISGGDSVVITGVGFLTTTAVNFGTTAATSFTIDSDTQITAISPAGSPGTVNVTVTSPLGTSAADAANQFTYLLNVSSVSPTGGTMLGGDSVVITGVGFSTATAVTFGTTAATSFVVNSDTQITAVSPAGSGTVDIFVTTPVGTTPATAADQFIYM